MKMILLLLKVQTFMLSAAFYAFGFSTPVFASTQIYDEQLKSKLTSALIRDQADQIEKAPISMIANLDRQSVLIPEEIRSLNLYKQSKVETVLTNSTHPNFFEIIKSEIILPICATKTGLKLCRHLYEYRNEDKQDEMNHFTENWSNISGFLNRLRIVVSDDPGQFSGFTVKFNPWIFLDLKKLTRAQVLRLVVHEMFQILDIKNQIHLSPAIRADLLADQIQCQELDFLLDHRLRLALSHVRAVRVEDLVLHELGFQFEIKNYEKLTCGKLISDDFKKLNLSLTLVNKLYYHEANLFLSGRNSCPLKKQFTEYLEMPRSVLETAVEPERISKLDQLEVRDQSYDRTETLCQFLIRPDLSIRRLWLSQFLTPSIFHGPKINSFELSPNEPAPKHPTSPLKDPTKPREVGPSPTGPNGPSPGGPRPVGD